ncbi:MAG: hypothetical protein H6Q73_3798 [Firmicutes bacterium]|nr:hypothetical protein [Bacillota bacterium]
MKESDIQNKIRIALSPHGTFFRVNVGQAWTGTEIIRTEGGGVYIPQARPFDTGVPKGFSDLFGVVPMFITPEMIGQRIGSAAFIEVKTKTGRVRQEQEKFLAFMRAKGCPAGIARSPEDAIKIIGGAI